MDRASDCGSDRYKFEPYTALCSKQRRRGVMHPKDAIGWCRVCGKRISYLDQRVRVQFVKDRKTVDIHDYHVLCWDKQDWEIIRKV